MKILKFSQILVIVCVSLIFYRLTLSSQPQWRLKDSEPFRIYFLDSDKIYTEQIASLLNISYLEIASKFGLKLTETVSVFICPTYAIFTDLTGHLVPDWGEGIADPVQNIIIIKSPGLTENERHLPKLIKHELVHILFGSAVEHP